MQNSCVIPTPHGKHDVPLYHGGYHTPLGRLSMFDISTVEIVAAPKMLALETSRRELSEDVSFGVGTLLVIEQWSFRKPLQGGVIHTVVYGRLCRSRVGDLSARS